MTQPKRLSLAERFWPYVDQSGECWLWTRSCISSGYGKVYDGTSRRDARSLCSHHVAWELTYGPVPEGLWVLHNCPKGPDRRCCNPAHLYLGTVVENSADMVRDGNSWRGDRNPMRDPLAKARWRKARGLPA